MEDKVIKISENGYVVYTFWMNGDGLDTSIEGIFYDLPSALNLVKYILTEEIEWNDNDSYNDSLSEVNHTTETDFLGLDHRKIFETDVEELYIAIKRCYHKERVEIFN